VTEGLENIGKESSVSVRKYRGSACRARGLNTIVEQKYETPPCRVP